MSSHTFRGKPCCACSAEWLPALEHELQRREILDGLLGVYQLDGNAAASAGTHKGGAADLVDLPGKEDLWVIRQMGADAAWLRTSAQGFSPTHIHLVLRGCPHNAAARYQIGAVDDGFNGLGRNGQGGADDGPRPLSLRTWREGIQWARQQEEDDMALSDADKKWIEAAIEKAWQKDQSNGHTRASNLVAVARKLGVKKAKT